MKDVKWFLVLAVLIQCKESGKPISQVSQAGPKENQPEGMVWIPGGEFIMGSKEQSGTQDAQPAHPVKVDGFWMDETEVTNRQYKEFVKATGYVYYCREPH